MKILCKQLENFVEGAVINYKVILSLSMRLQIVANHPYHQDCLHYDTFTLLCNLVSVLIPFLHDTLMLCAQRLTKESGMQKTRLPSATPDTILLSVKTSVNPYEHNYWPYPRKTKWIIYVEPPSLLGTFLCFLF